jgi:hypothetical protein
VTRKHSKKQQQYLRQLAGLAYERELSTASNALLQEFIRWEKKEIDVFQLNEKIHEFHHGVSRALYGRYTEMDTEFGVASALHRGVLSREEVGDEVFLSVEGIIMSLSALSSK